MNKRKNPRSIRLAPTLEADIESLAVSRDRSFNWLVTKALEEYLQRQVGVELEQEGDRTVEKVRQLEQRIAMMQRQIEALSTKPKLVRVQPEVPIADKKIEARQSYLSSVQETRAGYVSASQAIDDLF